MSSCHMSQMPQYHNATCHKCHNVRLGGLNNLELVLIMIETETRPTPGTVDITLLILPQHVKTPAKIKSYLTVETFQNLNIY
jgi:hypothetical protein